jgi:integrase
MSDGIQTARRQRVERGIYQRHDRDGKVVLEIGFRDAQGRQRWRRVDGGIIAARAALARAYAARSRGERVSADPRLRYDHAAQTWWDTRAVKLRAATQSAYAAGKKHLDLEFGGRRLMDISPADVAAFVSKQEAAGFKGWTIKGQLTVLRSIFNYSARHLGLVGVNPVSLLDRVERPRSDDERPKRILNPDELRRLIAGVDDEHRLIFDFAAQTGARLGEALGIAWGEVDLDAGTVNFTHQLDRHGQRVPLKTKRSRRHIEITPALAAALRKHKVAAPHSARHDLVFVNREGRGHDHRNLAGRVLARAVSRAGLGEIVRDDEVVEPAPTFHSLRHSHGSALIAAGWDIEEVSARLGHSDIGTTQRAYVHAYDASKRSESRRQRLAGMYDVTVTPETPTDNVGQPPSPSAGSLSNLERQRAHDRASP